MLNLDNPKQKSLVSVHLATFLFGLTGVFGKWIMASPTVIVAGRTFFAALALWHWLIYRRDLHFEFKKSDGLLWLISGGLLAFHWVAFFRGIQLTNVAIGLLTFSTFPLFTSILEPLLTQKPYSQQNLLLSLLILLGVAGIGWESLQAFGNIWGFAWGILSGASFAVLALMNRRIFRVLNGTQIAAGQNTVATFILLPLCYDTLGSLSLNTWAQLILLCVLFTGVAHTLLINSLDQLQAQTASLIVSLEPVYGILWGGVVLGEYPSWWTILGGCLVLLAGSWPTILTMQNQEKSRP